MFTFYHIKICAYIHTDMQTQNTKSWNIHVDTHTQKSEILANTQLRTASRIHVVVKSLQLPPLFSSFARAVSLLVKSWKESFQASFMQKRGILIMRFLNKNFNSFIEICLTYKAVHMISIWGKVSLWLTGGPTSMVILPDHEMFWFGTLICT